MRIDKITSSAEYRMDEQFQNSPICGAKFWFSKFEKFCKLVNFYYYKILVIY